MRKQFIDKYFAQNRKDTAKEPEAPASDETRSRRRPETIIQLPELRGGESQILNEEICRSLVPNLPARAQAYPWNRMYSTSAHGFSLKTFYRKMQPIDKPTLFIIKDVNDHIFGAILCCAFKVSEHFCGTGESLLFTFCPRFKVYNWNGANDFIVRCQLEDIVIGSVEHSEFGWTRISITDERELVQHSRMIPYVPVPISQ